MTTRRKRNASDMEDTVSSQESVTKDLEEMVVHCQVSGSSLESDTFKKPRMSRIKPLPTRTISSEKLEYIEESFLPDYVTLNLKFDEEKTCIQPVCPVQGNYIVDLAAMVRSLSDVASCIKCKVGIMEIFELKATDTFASKLIFRCEECFYSKVFMSVGEPTSSTTTNLLDLTSVLSSRLVGLNSEKLRTFSSCIGSLASTESTLFQQDTKGGTYCC